MKPKIMQFCRYIRRTVYPIYLDSIDDTKSQMKVCNDFVSQVWQLRLYVMGYFAIIDLMYYGHISGYRYIIFVRFVIHSPTSKLKQIY